MNSVLRFGRKNLRPDSQYLQRGFTHAKAGFTLLELLVVIAIMGLLSSVILVSINNARVKAGDSAVKQQLYQVRSQAGIYWSNNNNYGTNATLMAGNCFSAPGVIDVSAPDPNFTGTFFVDSVVVNMLLSADAKNNGASMFCAVKANGAGYSAWSDLPSSVQYCVDSEGAALPGTDTNSDGDCGA